MCGNLASSEGCLFQTLQLARWCDDEMIKLKFEQMLLLELLHSSTECLARSVVPGTECLWQCIICAHKVFFSRTWGSDRGPTGRLLPRRSVYQSGKGDKNSHAGATASTKN